ncbi:MAG: putative membrane protein YfcA [Paracoccaceae bacterium]|jgi:uncharacterized membrane protein YfcA
MFEITLQLFTLFVLAAFAAGFVDAIAGGGGLITTPVLLLSGMDPITALATNKLQGSFGAATAAYSYAQAGHVQLSSQIFAASIAFATGALGAFAVSFIPSESLRRGLPVILIAIALFFAFKRGLTDDDKVRRLSEPMFTAFFVPLIGAYDGLIGPGAGTFYMIGFVLLAGYGILKATAHTKLLNFSSNFGSLLVFAIYGAPMWKLGLVMGMAQIAGARVGSIVAMRVGSLVIKPLLVVTSTLLAGRLLWQIL